nr:hypothetical protein [Pandoravirus aubagnensis]
MRCAFFPARSHKTKNNRRKREGNKQTQTTNFVATSAFFCKACFPIVRPLLFFRFLFPFFFFQAAALPRPVLRMATESDDRTCQRAHLLFNRPLAQNRGKEKNTEGKKVCSTQWGRERQKGDRCEDALRRPSHWAARF